jgi:S1-C subfamily serine protease
VLVTGVERGSLAKRGGQPEGDVIIGLAGEAMSEIDDLQRVLTSERFGEGVGESVVTNQTRLFLLLYRA